MLYTITANVNGTIQFTPQTLAEEVLQNVVMILTTIKNTAPLYRDFGLSARFLDMPTPAAEAKLVAELFDALAEYEPRAEVTSISFERNERTGKLCPRLEVNIHDE